MSVLNVPYSLIKHGQLKYRIEYKNKKKNKAKRIVISSALPISCPVRTPFHYSQGRLPHRALFKQNKKTK
jgi:hypothetical protein